MKYIQEILMYLTLPLTIIVSYYAVAWGIKKFEKTLGVDEEEAE